MIVLCLWLLLTGGRGRLVVAGLFGFLVFVLFLFSSAIVVCGCG